MMYDAIIKGCGFRSKFSGAKRPTRESCGACGPAAWPDHSKLACYAPVAYVNALKHAKIAQMNAPKKASEIR